MSDVPAILHAIESGDPTAPGDLLPLVYEELRRLAAAKLARDDTAQTLQPTALVHEAWLRLAGHGERHFKGRRHFFAAAAEAMRHILIDRARRKRALKRGAGVRNLDLDQIDVAIHAEDETLLVINDALDQLAREDPAAAELIKLRFFAGFNNAEAARALDISERSAKRYWAFARAWLYRQISRRPIVPQNIKSP